VPVLAISGSSKLIRISPTNFCNPTCTIVVVQCDKQGMANVKMEDRFNINTDDPTPIYAQLERAIRFAIATDKLRVGERLPTVRQLAVDLKINANTVAKVYAELERTGILETQRGVGTFVRALPRNGGSHEGESLCLKSPL
jgi:DNA-binding transcriptional regulator YhcF (GntR family)